MKAIVWTLRALFVGSLLGALTAPMWQGQAWSGWLWGGVLGSLVLLLVLRWVGLAKEKRSPQYL
ncbi:MAG: hypothetical protein D6724_06730 [Armatimonadetes bacterium]|nr:MAG: hypothetical protein D6724_06730 [Armatimonadota bacterium]GIV02344.1 MAG: hypothetical protein KatS3mg015_1174 [Fimbriimonadales bacterium]